MIETHYLPDWRWGGSLVEGLCEDLIDLADAFLAKQSSPTYRWQADLIGTTSGVDQADLDALLAKFGGRP